MTIYQQQQRPRGSDAESVPPSDLEQGPSQVAGGEAGKEQHKKDACEVDGSRQRNGDGEQQKGDAGDAEEQIGDPPEKPLPGDCCGSGCVRCVWDIYYEELEEYNNKLKHRNTRPPPSSSASS